MKRIIDGDTLHVVDGGDNTVLTIRVLTGEDTATLVVSGGITHDAAPEFEDELMAVLTSAGAAAVDFSTLKYISAPALQTLLSVQRLVDEKHYDFHIQNITGEVKETFVQTGFIDLLDIR